MHLYVWSLRALCAILYLSRVTHAHWLWEFASRAMEREWKEYKRALNRQEERRPVTQAQAEQRGRRQTGNKSQEIRMSLNSCTEHAHSPCGLLMRRSWENLWKPLALCHPANWLNIFINFYYMYTRRPAVMNEWPHKQHILVSCGHWLFGSFHCGFFLTLIYSEGSKFSFCLWKRKHKTSRQVKALTANRFNLTSKDGNSSRVLHSQECAMMCVLNV